MIYQITPVPKPRQTQRDKWAKRASVLRYRAFADEVRMKKVVVTSNDFVTFYIPMAKSWSQKKKVKHVGQAHTQVPDLDNLIKSLLDAIFDDDAHIWRIAASKVWSIEGSIEIKKLWL